MFGKYRKAIITDQDKAICNAIKKVLPDTRHSYCAWHIKQHELQHLRPYVTLHSDFQESYREWVKSETVEEFETKREVIRVDEVRVFMHFFDGFVNLSTMLNEFVRQYDKAVESRRAAEEDEDFKTMNSRAILSSVHPIEAKAGECYTRKVFEIFKKEWMEATSNLTHDTLSKSKEEIKYRVGQLNIDKTYWRVVSYRSLNQVSVTCSCAKFETYGILCKHSLYVMKKRHVETLPSHYILPRWTISSRYKVGNGSIGLQEIDNENGVSAFTLWCVRSNFTKVIEQSRDSPLEVQKLNTLLIGLLDDQAIRKKNNVFENVSQGSCVGISQVDMMPQLSVRDPIGPTKTKGRPKVASRLKSFLEVPKKKDMLLLRGIGSLCHWLFKEKGHYAL
ncbi:hypothetical protein LXL04_021199 [Taraxacum kok-saghyz]